jgi:hypothetical protein
VDGFNGTSGDDTFTGLVNSSGTYSVGDNIIGGAGNDTLNLIAQSATDAAGGLVSVAGVENVNVRLLTTAGATASFNAADWTGVAVLSNASSVAGSLLQVSGLDTTTKVNLNGDTDINVAYDLTTTATSAVTIALTNAGNFGTGARTFAGTGFSATANIDIDLGDAGLLTAVNVEINGGANAARLEAGSNVKTYTLSGAGSAILVTDDTITSFNASTMTGGVDVTFEGASDVVAQGGEGNDTFRFGTTFSNNDSVNGGNGTDTVTVTVAGFDRNLNTTDVENATVTFNAGGATVNASGSTVSTFALAAGSAADGSVSQIANAATITLADDDLAAVTLDYATGAASTTINIGSASGAVGLGTLTVTDVTAVTINSVGTTGADNTVVSASFDSDVKSLTVVSSGGEAGLSIGDTVAMGGVTNLTVTSNGSAGVNFSTGGFGTTAVASITLNANANAADILAGSASSMSLTSVALNNHDVTLEGLVLGNRATADGQTQDTTITLSQAATSTMAVGAITFSGQGTLNLSVTQNSTGATATFGAIALSDSVATGDSTVNLNVGAVTVGENGSFNLGAVTVTAAADTTAGAQITIGSVDIGQAGYYGVSGIALGSAGVRNVDVSSVTVSVGASASFNFGNVDVAGASAGIGGGIGARSVTLNGASAVATFGTVAASSIGSLSLSAQGSGAGLVVGNMTAAQTVGAIELAGIDGVTATIGTIVASAVGAISVSGAMDVAIGAITAERIGTIDARNLTTSGSFSINLNGVSANAEVNLGAATNVVISGKGNDTITLLGGRTATAGNDTIQFTTATDGVDSIVNFIAGAAASGGDVIALGVTGMALRGQSAQGVAITADAVVDLFLVTAGGATSTMTAADSIILLGSAFATTAGMIAAIVDGGTQEIILNGTAATGSTYTIVWTDGNDSYVSLLQVSGATGLSLTTGSVSTLAVISGVTPGALVAANFDFV